MRIVALVSGGKDSCFNMLQCVAAGHEIVALANLRPSEVDELDSYMYQTVGHDAIDLYSEAMGLPLYREYIRGTSILQGYDYEPSNKEDEVEDLYRLLSSVKERETIEGVAVGAILSNYQRIRVENVCSRLGLTSLCYLWQRDQEELLGEMIAGYINAVLIKVAALGLTPEKHLGKTIEECQAEFSLLKKKFGLNVCGEGGEYETLTLDCPLFKKRIDIVESKVIYHSKDPFAPVAYLVFPKLRLLPKDQKHTYFLEAIKKPSDFCSEELNCDTSSSNSGELQTDQLHEEIQPISALPANASFPIVCNRTELGTLFLSGFNANSEEEFETLMESFQDVLKANGSNPTKVVSVSLYVRDMTEYSRLNAIYAKYFGSNPPVRACVQVPTVSFAQLESIAIDCEQPKQNMHVQSISHWAPANIGPYSQCVQVDKLFLVSGQIGLVPGSMTLPKPSNFSAECLLALRHTTRILNAMDSELDLQNAIQAVCYVRSEAHLEPARLIWEQFVGSSKCALAIVIVSGLPRNALVEWQVTAHKETAEILDFQITSSTKAIGAIQVNKQENVSVLTGYLGELPTESTTWSSFYWLIAKALGPVCSVRIYHLTDLESKQLDDLRSTVPSSISITLVPVCKLESNRAAVVCGLSF